MQAIVLRYGHRPIRDERVTTHCCLVARAFGADKIFIHGPEDKTIIQTINTISEKWGSGFSAEFTDSWKTVMAEFKKKGFKTIHLTMYGLQLGKEIKKIRKMKKVLVIIGSQKVEREVYEQSDLNISITNQPHSEIAALSVFLHELFSGKEKKFKKAELKITPTNKGKKIIKTKK